MRQCLCVLQGAALVYFDGRLAEGAVVLARAARAAGVPVMVEAERLRPGLDDLLGQADFVFTSAHFPQVLLPGAALHSAALPLWRTWIQFQSHGSGALLAFVLHPDLKRSIQGS